MSVPNQQFDSPFALGNPNEPILLSEERVTLATYIGWFVGTGGASIKFLPRPRVEIIASFPDIVVPFAGSPNQILGLGLPDRGLEVPGFSVSSQFHRSRAGSSSSVAWLLSPSALVVDGNSTTNVSSAIFHLVNFVDFTSPTANSERAGNTDYRINHLLMSWKDFVVQVRSLPTTNASMKTLHEQGGFAITHLGRITDKAGGTFLASEIEDLLEGLRFFFSFVRGAWVSAVLPVGFDQNGIRVWEYWNSPNGEPYADVHSWFDPTRAYYLENLFPAFMNFWTDANWKPAIREAIYWYLNSNYSPRGIDAGLILTQTAIERLCFAYTVENGRFLSRDGFQRLSVADRLRVLYASLGIPQDLPASPSELRRLAGKHNWADAPQALMEMRNAQVHPQEKRRGQFDKALYEAWNLGLWYVEMVLLRLFGHNGTYVNRLPPPMRFAWVQPVPWKA